MCGPGGNGLAGKQAGHERWLGKGSGTLWGGEEAKPLSDAIVLGAACVFRAKWNGNDNYRKHVNTWTGCGWMEEAQH